MLSQVIVAESVQNARNAKQIKEDSDDVARAMLMAANTEIRELREEIAAVVNAAESAQSSESVDEQVLRGDVWECVPKNVTMENVTKMVSGMGNLPVYMKFPETALLGGKRFVVYGKG